MTIPGCPRPTRPGHVGPTGQSLLVQDAETQARWVRQAGSCCGCSSAVSGGHCGGSTPRGQGPPRVGSESLRGCKTQRGLPGGRAQRPVPPRPAQAKGGWRPGPWLDQLLGPAPALP